MEHEIALFFLKASKFEYFLVSTDISLAKTSSRGLMKKIEGVNWQKVAAIAEDRCPFDAFDFAASGFAIFKETAPQFLVDESGELKWDSDDEPIDSWDHLLRRSYAQLRNNIAHGNKARLPSAFTYERTGKFLEAGTKLIDFIAAGLFDHPNWELPIEFR
ncbi:MAG: hypothetical protein OJI67_21905 [Prosthecobacter sp.]|nr:hypothetical protein [Prosthecobacter sp.]